MCECLGGEPRPKIVVVVVVVSLSRCRRAPPRAMCRKIRRARPPLSYGKPRKPPPHEQGGVAAPSAPPLLMTPPHNMPRLIGAGIEGIWMGGTPPGTYLSKYEFLFE